LERLQRWLDPKELEARARATGFQRRKPKQNPALLFVEAAILLVGQSVVSLSRWAVLLGIPGHRLVSKQAVWKRLLHGAVGLLQEMLGLVLAERVTQVGAALPKALRCFSRVLVQDSTVIKLIAKLARLFPGSRNQRGAKHGQLKIQSVYDLLTQRFVSFSSSGFNRNDQAAAVDILPLLQKGDLVSRDLGYFVIQTFQRIALAGAFFLSRLRLDTHLYDVDRTILHARAVAQVYGLRWRIETIFKAWKSHFRITQVPKGSADQLLALIYARLIFLTLMIPWCTHSWQEAWTPDSPPPRSLLKTAALLGDFFLILCLEFRHIQLTDALTLQLDYHGRYERRSRHNFIEQLSKLS
jgi:hypothetical protein